MPFRYSTIATDTNFIPIAIEVRRDGVPLPLLGVEVTLFVKDRDTGVIVVDNQRASPHPTIVGRWEYYFEPAVVAGILNNAIWLVEWKVKAGPYSWRTPEPAILPVRRKLSNA
jgi:hypothetical protein